MPGPGLPWGIKATAIWRWMRLLVVTLVISVLALGLLAWFFQRRLIYAPSPGPVALPGGSDSAGLREVELQTADGVRLKAWHLRGRRRGTVLWLHGNAGNRGDRLGVFAALRELEIGVLMPDYRGYGGSEGTPSEAGFTQDAEACHAWLSQYAPGPLVYVGVSIGSGVAVELAVRHAPAGLILLSPFPSLVDVADVHYAWLPAGLFLRDRYENARKIPGVHCPLLVIHGDQDDIVPLKLGRALFDAANEPKTWLQIEGAGHNDLASVDPTRYWHAVKTLLDDCLRSP